MIGLGMIGCGWAAGEIARVAVQLPGLSIISVFDTDADRAASLSARTGARQADDIDALLADRGVTAIYVGVPHALIASIVERALAAGKHVLAEKPLALDPATARALGRQATAAGLTLCVFFELRRSGTVAAAKRLLGAGEIGEPRLIRIRTVIDKRPDYWGRPGAPNWRASRRMAGGGVLLMNSIHQLDTLRYVTGLEFVAAQGEIATFRAIADVEDAASATLRLSNGAIVSIVASAHSPGADHEETIEIDGSAGRLDLPDPFGTGPLRLYRADSQAWNEITVDRPDSHRLMIESFMGAIVGKEGVPATAEDAAAAVAAINAIYESARAGRRVTLP